MKLATLAPKTLYKPIANRLKKDADLHPKFRQLIINIGQVAGAALIFGVLRNARSKAKEEEIRKQEIEEMEQQMQTVKQYLDDQMKQQMQTVKQDLEDLMKQMQAMKQDLNDLHKEVETLNQQTRD